MHSKQVNGNGNGNQKQIKRSKLPYFDLIIWGISSRLAADRRRGTSGESSVGTYCCGGGGRAGGGDPRVPRVLGSVAKRSPGDRVNFFRRAGGVGLGNDSLRTTA